jgi:periplasmic protein TonB
MAAAPNIAETVADAGVLTEPSVIALDEFVPHIEPIARVRDGGSWRWSLVAAFLLHVGIIAAFSYTPADTTIGGGGTELESISVDVVSASALEVIASAPAAAASQVDKRLADREGSENERAATLKMPDQKSERAPETPSKAEVADLVIPDMMIKPEPPVPDQPSIVIAPAKAEQPVEALEKPDDTKAKPQSQEAATPSVAAEDAMAEQIGGVSQRGVSAVEIAQQSAAIARAGEIAAYARRVQFAVAKNPPKPPPGTGSRGEVVITFALDADGSLAYARVYSSSGNTQLDDAALKAVRGTQFPPPPPGSEPKQLIYKFPVKFR